MNDITFFFFYFQFMFWWEDDSFPVSFLFKKILHKLFQQTVPDALIMQTPTSAPHNTKRFQTIMTD